MIVLKKEILADLNIEIGIGTFAVLIPIIVSSD